MSAQLPLILGSFNEALNQIVLHAGGPKRVAPLLWPLKSERDAYTSLMDCLNPTRREKFDLEQIVRLLQLGREAGFHGAKHWLDEETGYEPSAPADPKVQHDRAAEAVLEAAATLAKALSTLERLQGKSTLRSAA